MKGRLKSITLQSSQEAWKVDFPEIPDPVPLDEHGQPQASTHRVPISTSHITSRSAGQPQHNQKRGASTSEQILEKDDDVFMPPAKLQSCARASSSLPRSYIRRAFSASTTSKLPSVRCAPSIFIKFTEHLNMPQRRKIIELGFGGLLLFSAEELDDSDLLVYLMDKLNPDTMILEVGNEGGLRINEFCVKQVLGLPDGDRDPPSSTEQENSLSLVDFKKSVHVEPSKEVKCNHLLNLLRKLNIDNDLGVRIFFVVAFNKLLFPALDNNIRGQDAFLSKDLSQFRNINWCKALVHELRHAAIMWRSDRKKSVPGCGIFLIIFYLDNLDARSSIVHSATPRVRYFHKSLMEKLIQEDKRRDKYGNVTYGNLQLKNIANTCYQYTEPYPSGEPTSTNYHSIPMFPRAEQLGVLFNEIASSSARNKATDVLQQFAAKSSQAINFIQSGSNMLVDAHKEFIHTMRSIFEKESVENIARGQDSMDNGPTKENESRALRCKIDQSQLIVWLHEFLF